VLTFKKLFQLALGQRIAERISFIAPSVTGVGKVDLTVSGQGFTTAKSYDIQTRLGWGAITRTETSLQKTGETYAPPVSLLNGLAAGDVELQVSYSPFRGFDPTPIALSLSRYPYGCTEQLVSSAYPLLLALQVSDDPKLRRSSAGLNQAVGQLIDRQSTDGAFGLWRVGDGEADAWLGAYATDFLIEASRRGAPVSQASLDKALDAMRQISQPEGYTPVSYKTSYSDSWAGSKEASKNATQRLRSRASAYALYDLAKGGRGDLSRLRWWHDVQMKAEASPLARAQVGAGLAMMGDKARAHSAMQAAVSALGYRDDNDWYQSPLRDLAGVIALAYEAGEPAIARNLQGRLEGAVRDPDQLNTQEQARLLQAAAAMMTAAGPFKIEAKGALALNTAAGAPRWAVGKLADAAFVNRGGEIYRTVTVRGTPVAAPPPASNGLTIGKRLFSMSGGGVDTAGFKQGDRVIIQVAGRSLQGRSTQLVVDDALPAGFEIEAVLTNDDAKSGPYKFLGELSAADVQESRDDRYVASLQLEGNKPYALAYIARAVTPGAFFLPGVTARDMYHASIQARSGAGSIKIAAGP
ncbi:MAG: alpha-2-macroglobulin, partial [Caulobacteraceae bacterium]|nr:alpha-2-macroglobulin [Caulobacteraceae bacterium]